MLKSENINVNKLKTPVHEKKRASSGISFFWVCIFLGFLLFALFIASLAVPGYLTYRYRGKVHTAVALIKNIHSGLNQYIKSSTNHSYPERISDYNELRTLLNKLGVSAPETADEAYIAKIGYLRKKADEYLMYVEVDVDYSERYYIVSPKGIKKSSEIPDPLNH